MNNRVVDFRLMSSFGSVQLKTYRSSQQLVLSASLLKCPKLLGAALVAVVSENNIITLTKTTEA